jgi:hypothetical protein
MSTQMECRVRLLIRVSNSRIVANIPEGQGSELGSTGDSIKFQWLQSFSMRAGVALADFNFGAKKLARTNGLALLAQWRVRWIRHVTESKRLRCPGKTEIR